MNDQPDGAPAHHRALDDLYDRATRSAGRPPPFTLPPDHPHRSGAPAPTDRDALRRAEFEHLYLSGPQTPEIPESQGENCNRDASPANIGGVTAERLIEIAVAAQTAGPHDNFLDDTIAGNPPATPRALSRTPPAPILSPLYRFKEFQKQLDQLCKDFGYHLTADHRMSDAFIVASSKGNPGLDSAYMMEAP